MNLRSLLASFLLLSFTASSLSLGTISAFSGNENGVSVLTEESSQSPELLSPVEYGFPSTAQEVLSKRTLNTATFSLGGRRFAQVSVGGDLFTKDEHGNMVLSNDKGVQVDNEFVFDRLPQNTQVRFNSSKPEYTMIKDGQVFTLSFQVEPTPGEILNDHQIAYQLSETARLVWTVDGGTVKKEIYVKNTGTNPEFPFTVESETLTQTLQDNTIVLKDSEGKIVFQTKEPFLMTTEKVQLENAVKLIENDNGGYGYAYDEAGLPAEYILDPDTGFLFPGTVSGWGNSNNVLASDNTYATATSGTPMFVATNFGFNIPSGATIDGFEAELEGYADCGENCYIVGAYLVIGGVTSGTGLSSPSSGSFLWGASEGVRVFGGPTDLWEATDLTPTIVNNSGFGFAFAGVSETPGGGDTYYLDSVKMKVYYTPDLASNGDACTSDGDCSSGHCIYGVCSSICACGGSSLDLPSGYVLKKQSDFTTVSLNTLSVPTKVYVVKSDGNVIVAGLVLKNEGTDCNMNNAGIAVNSGKNAAFLHAPGVFGSGKFFSLFVPNQSGNSVNICNGATSAACNTSVTTTRNTQGYSSGIDYRIATVQGTQYKIVSGLSSTSIEEAGSGGSAPEFSIPALMLTLAGSLYIVHRFPKKEKIV